MGKVKYVLIAVLAISIAAGLPLMKKSFAEDEESPGPGGAVFASVFWVGQSETDCVVRSSLLMDNLEECEAEYERAEKEVSESVARKNSRGGNWKWGVFKKCARFPSSDDYDKEIGNLENQCGGR